MGELYDWLGDLNQVEGLASQWAGLITLLASIFCGAFIGVEREKRDKPAGLRTVILICVGSTIFTMVSVFISRKVSGATFADPGRIASQVAPGIGFLGAGAIIQSRGTVTGLTTAATIWAVAAVGVTIGSGYVAAGLVFTMIIFLTLSVVQRLEWIVVGRCEQRTATVSFQPDGGKTRIRLRDALDHFEIPDADLVEGVKGKDLLTLTFPFCESHREHRVVLKTVVEIPAVVEVEIKEIK